MQQLPGVLQEKIMRYRKWEDAHRSLLGKALLLYGLKQLQLSDYSLDNLKYTEYDRPYFNDDLDFNISHAGEYIICALSKTNKVGVDIEHVIKVPVEDYESNFTDDEWEIIFSADDMLYSFFEHWTKKEAFLKAIGMGLNTPLHEIETKTGKIHWEEKDWFLHKVNIEDGYISYLSCDVPKPFLATEQVNFN
ncbi:MAG TPA: 4'-phosphopantetheinyl transferase superfamily protein [Chitinophagaceae bacterium]|nr:4'-phosphopantetheinyl transferase superfamily protein [Chitinophagaceae bacterium]